jgi:flagellar biogenesis protein FliO
MVVELTRTTPYRVTTNASPMAGKAPIEPMVERGSLLRDALEMLAVLVPIWVLGWIVAKVAG